MGTACARRTERIAVARRMNTSAPSVDRKSTRLNSSHLVISYAVFCLKKKKKDEFDIGDLYVICNKAASGLRDEFVYVTEKLMDELVPCYTVLHRVDINNTIDHRADVD